MNEISVGKEVTIDFHQCRPEFLNDCEAVKELIHEIARMIEVTIVREEYHQFTPYGVTGVAIVSESHIAVHTWPEFCYCSVDIFSCKGRVPHEIFPRLEELLGASSYTSRDFQRTALVTTEQLEAASLSPDKE